MSIVSGLLVSQATSYQLSNQATLRLIRADRCHAVADALDLRGAVLAERHLPVLELHTAEVWRGRAATHSRSRLQRYIGAELYSLREDLAATSGALRGEASRLEQEAAVLQQRARLRAAEEAEEEAARERPPNHPAGRKAGTAAP